MCKRKCALLRLLAFLICFPALVVHALPPATPLPGLPLSFESNRGQAPAAYSYVLHRGDMQAMFSDGGVDFRLPGSRIGSNNVSTKVTGPLRFNLIGASPNTHPAGELPNRAESNYLLGADSSRWIAHVPNYSRVVYRGIYPGVSLVFYGRDGELEHDFTLAPLADPAVISFRMEGAQRVELSPEGNLHIASSAGALVLKKPTAYQQAGGKLAAVDVSFLLAPDGRVSFRVGSYDRSRPLVIDPVLTFSTYLDGSTTDNITAVTTDGGGNIYLTGFTTSTDFPTVKPLQPASGCGSDGCNYVFITKLDPTGKTLIYSTYLGGGFEDSGGAIAVDAQGDAIVAGTSSSSNFPQAGSLPARPSRPDCYFLASLTPDGSAFNYSGLIGGSQGAYAPNDGRVAVDAAGNAYLAGVTDDQTFPITPGTLAPTFSGYPNSITFVMKVAPSGQLLYSTVIPGNAAYNPLDVFTNLFSVTGISIDASGQAIVAGSAGAGLPTTAGVVAPNYPNPTDVESGEAGFILQLNSTASAINYATYIPGTDLVGGMAIDSKGNFYLAGETSETNLPTSATAYQKTVTVGREGGIQSGYVIELNPQVTSILAATYLNGTNSSINGGTSLRALALDSHNNVFVGGLTGSADFPLQDPLTAEYEISNTSAAMVLAALPPDLSSLSFGSYLSSADGIFPGSLFAALTVDANDNFIVAGTTYANDFPTTAGSFQTSPPPSPTPNAGYDHTFVAKINMSIPAPSVCPSSWNVNLGQVNALTAATVTLNVTNCGNAPLSINSITSSLATVTTAENCASIAPGAICPIALTFNPIDSTASGGTLSLEDNAVVSPQVIAMSGQGIAPNLTTRSNPFPMGHYFVGTQSPVYPLILFNQGNAPLTMSSFTITGNGFSINQNGCTAPVAGGSLCIVGLVFAPAVPGAAGGTLSIASNDPVHPQFAIALSGAGDSAYDAPSISVVGPGNQVVQQTVPINNGPVNLQIAGSNFYPASLVQFNGVPQPTTFMTNNLIQVSLLASSLTALGEFPLTVVNPTPGGGVSPAVTMTTYQYLPLTTSAIVSVPATKLIYAAILSTSTSNPNTVIPIDPTTGATQTPIPVGNNPVLLAASSDGSYLFVANSGDSTVQRINLATNRVEGTYPFAPNVYCPQCEILPATDLQTIPGVPLEAVLAQGHMAALYNGSGLVNYVPGTQILTAAPMFNSIAFAGNPLTLYAEPFTSVQNSFFNTAAITSSGLSYTPVSGSNPGPPAGTGFQIVSDGTLLYTNTGQVWAPSTQTQVGSFPVDDTYDDASLVLDTGQGQLYAGGLAEPFVDLAITSYGVKSLAMQATLAFPSINGDELYSLTRWGNNGFAFVVPFVYTGAGGVYLTRSDGLTNQQLLNPVPSLTSLSPTSANAGDPAVVLTVNGRDFLPASTVTWNGAALPTTYISGAQLRATIPASDLATAGTADVTVTTPTPGGGTSSLQGFTVNPVAPVASLSGSSIEFGMVTQGTASAPQPVTLTNSGNAALAISSIAATGDFTETNNCGATLASSAACQIQLVFTPTATGVRSGTLTFVDNAHGAPQIITLQGTGVAPVDLAPAAGSAATATVSSAGTANYNLSLTAAPGFAGKVTLSCSGAPQNAICTVNPATVTLASAGSAKFSVTVTTGVSQSAALPWTAGPRLAGLGIVSLLLLPLLNRIRTAARCFGLCVAIVCVAFALSGCGGGSMTMPSNPAPLATPAGTYQLTVTATAGTSQVKQSLTLTVQ
jgi:Abnormal spindle-like microcephaly-assoc'd, ASPM-SPD-2-Hydin